MTKARLPVQEWEESAYGKGFASELMHQLVVPAFVIDATGRVILWNQACERLTGMPAADVLGTREHWRAFYSDRRPCLADLILAGRDGEISDFYPEHRGGTDEGREAHAENWCVMPLRGVELYLALDARSIRDADGRVIAVVETLRDQTARRRAETKLQLVASVFEGSQEGILITDPEQRILDVNLAFTRMTGYSRDEVLGKTPAILRSGLQDARFYRQMWRQLAEKGHWQGEIWNRRKSGEVFPETLHINAVHDERGAVSHYIGMFIDISDLKTTQQRLVNLSHYDELTNLPNRVLLARRLHEAMERASGFDRLVAICSLDLDDFKQINDRYGHETGNRLLVEVANRLRSTIGPSDVAGRLGGDEFVLLLTDLDSADGLEEMLARIFTQVTRSCYIDDAEISVSASIGVTLYPLDDSDPDTLLRHADHAMYQSKQLGRNRYQLFDMEAAKDLRAQHQELERIREALQYGELRLFYQPKVNLRTGQVVGLEALIRWQKDADTLLGPQDFLPIVEHSPLIVDIGEWVLRQAIDHAMQWREQGLDLIVSVNIAARHFQHPDFLAGLQRVLAEHPEMPPDRLELEILESTALDDVLTMRALMAECQRIGVRFALDDFGTGYSSLSYLKQLPADTLKIDRSFVRDMLDDQDDLALVEGVIGLAATFRKQVVAEGVETPEHGLLLMQLECDYAQGFGIARPMPAEQVAEWISSYRPDWKWTLFADRRCRIQDMPVLLAGYEYSRWLERLVKGVERREYCDAMNGIEELPSPRFLAWLKGEGRRYYGRLPEYRELTYLHYELLHACARVGAALDLDDGSVADAVCEDLQELERRILAMTQALQRRTAIP
ncbi:EAL domain-containing protein [Thiorhodococcus mannitoliphagus]|uniref:EAL domain-containing protein n=1 Tax=Thiorhodococcus mannitoliphagus TaxID=329406 RepID=A0A6P1E0F8_9GAMM|nr:bifunctional diguanylate cyclase/phosphodiesterase [Thiorhodococcus mannitoliphagus]NEX22526.1 EAL domain-containing protein [Thiorhodococcus mannitoliphagus]